MRHLSPFLKISLIYIALGCLWIIFSDKLVLMLFGSSSASNLTLIQNFKGIFYVIVTSVLLYFLVKVYYRKHRSADEKYKQFFYQNPTPMWVYDPETLRFVDVNQSAQTQYGFNREEFAFITSHNLRAHLASILGLTHIFNKEKIDDPLNLELVAHLQTSAKKLDYVIADLSTILDMKTNLEDTQEVVNLQEVMVSILVKFLQQITDNMAEIRIDFEAVDRLKINKAYIKNYSF